MLADLSPSCFFLCVFVCLGVAHPYRYYKAGIMPKPYASMGNIQNVMGIMFSSTSFLGMTNLMAVMPLVGESCSMCMCMSLTHVSPARWCVCVCLSACLLSILTGVGREGGQGRGGERKAGSVSRQH